MGDFNKPVKTDQYESLLARIRELFADVATLIDSRRASPTNIPTYAKRWDAINNKLLSFEGGTWISKVLSLAGGGTGSSSASGARANLDVDSSAEVTAKVTAHNAVTNPHSASSTAVSDRLVLRDASGRAQVANPSVSADIATKGYVDTNLSIPSGTSMLFNQAAAPVGWTKETGWSNSTILVGDTYGSGGSDNPVSWSPGVSVDDHSAHTHSGPNHTHIGSVHQHIMGAHNHQWYDFAPTEKWTYNSSGSKVPFSAGSSNGYPALNTDQQTNCLDFDGYTNNKDLGNTLDGGGTSNTGYSGTGNTGSAGPTTHSVTQETYTPKYQIMIAATKD